MPIISMRSEVAFDPQTLDCDQIEALMHFPSDRARRTETYEASVAAHQAFVAKYPDNFADILTWSIGQMSDYLAGAMTKRSQLEDEFYRGGCAGMVLRRAIQASDLGTFQGIARVKDKVAAALGDDFPLPVVNEAWSEYSIVAHFWAAFIDMDPVAPIVPVIPQRLPLFLSLAMDNLDRGSKIKAEDGRMLVDPAMAWGVPAEIRLPPPDRTKIGQYWRT